jgi:fatty-acyl-CoA synthase
VTEEPTTPAGPPSTVAELVARRADDDNVGLVLDGQSWTWREVVAQSCVRADWLRCTLDPSRPANIGVLLPNTPDYVFTLLGAALAGVCVVGINPTRRGAELRRDVEHTDCQLVLTNPEQSDLLAGLTTAAVVSTQDAPWQGCAGAGLPAGLPDPESLLLLIFTSGSTSAPKAVRRTQGRIVAGADIGFRPSDVLYCAMPLFHGNALSSNLFPGLLAGSTIVLRERFSASRWLYDVRTHGATFANTVGRALGYVLATPPSEQDKDHRLRVVLAPESSPRDAEVFAERFGVRVVSGYGQSEGVIALLPVAREGALGKAPRGVDVAVVDAGTRQECAVAELGTDGLLRNAEEAIGELVRRDAGGGFEGYWRNSDADAERTRGGWYWSGDLAYRDADGIFWFAGRVGDWLRVDSENFASAPIERILTRHPDLAAVAVVGVPDPQGGDQLLAVVEPLPGRTFDLMSFPAFLAGQGDLGTKWAPRFVRVCTALPVTGNDKVDKRPLRAAAWLTTDPVWWRPPGELAYQPFTGADAEQLRTEFDQHGRSSRHPEEP